MNLGSIPATLFWWLKNINNQVVSLFSASFPAFFEEARPRDMVLLKQIVGFVFIGPQVVNCK